MPASARFWLVRHRLFDGGLWRQVRQTISDYGTEGRAQITLCEQNAVWQNAGMKILTVLGVLGACVVVSACTDSKRATMETKFTDQPAEITCWSFGTEIFNGKSTGRVNRDGGGAVFVDAANGRLTAVDGECRIVYLPKAD